MSFNLTLTFEETSLLFPGLFFYFHLLTQIGVHGSHVIPYSCLLFRLLTKIVMRMVAKSMIF